MKPYSKFHDAFVQMSREEILGQLAFTAAALTLSITDTLKLEGKPVNEGTVHAATMVLSYRVHQQAAAAAGKQIVHLLLAALLLSGMAFGQARPRLSTQAKAELALDAADVTVRALDLRSTYTLLNASCRCFHEDDPLAPKGKALGPMLLFQTSMSASAIAGGHRLMTHGHRRLGLLTIAADIAMESWSVQHNMRQHGPVRPAATAPNTTGHLLPATGGR